MTRFLLDTYFLLWLAFDRTQLSPHAQSILSDTANSLHFSPISIWEVAIKFYRNKPDFIIDPVVLRRTLRENGVTELPLRSEHAIATLQLPPTHKGPFDRILIAHAITEDPQLLTADATIAQYPGPILQV